MQCLVDGDVLRYEVGFASEASFKYSNPDKPKEFFLDNAPSWGLVEEILEQRITRIELECGATLPSIIFFTGKGNFRNDIAKRQPYKDRAGHKPFHFKNIELYLKTYWEWRERDGLEADDLMAIEQCSRSIERDTIICTRDKDLRGVPGWSYGWECGKQPSFGPYYINGYGFIQLSDDRSKIEGWGDKFFLSQCLTGDSVDSVPGLPKCGPVASFELLQHTTSYEEGLNAVLTAYTGRYGLDGWNELLEQGRLLWMTRELDSDDLPKLWEINA